MKWVLFVSIALWTYFILLVVTNRRRRMGERVGEALDFVENTSKPAVMQKNKDKQRAFKVFVKKLSKSGVRKQSEMALAKLSLRLAQAGHPLNLTPSEWIGFRVLLLGSGALVGFMLLMLIGGSLLGFVVLLLATIVGLIAPDFWISRTARIRQTMIMKQFPSTLDLLTVSVEAGLGFDQALSRVSQKLKGPLAEELERTLKEIRLGSQRSAALQRFADRTGVETIQLFVSALIQADRLGMGLAQVLRVQSAEARLKRKMDAQERAMKAPVKMLFPLIIFVFPALFVVVLGPAILHILSIFSGQN